MLLGGMGLRVELSMEELQELVAHGRVVHKGNPRTHTPHIELILSDYLPEEIPLTLINGEGVEDFEEHLEHQHG